MTNINKYTKIDLYGNIYLTRAHYMRLVRYLEEKYDLFTKEAKKLATTYVNDLNKFINSKKTNDKKIVKKIKREVKSTSYAIVHAKKIAEKAFWKGITGVTENTLTYQYILPEHMRLNSAKIGPGERFPTLNIYLDTIRDMLLKIVSTIDFNNRGRVAIILTDKDRIDIPRIFSKYQLTIFEAIEIVLKNLERDLLKYKEHPYNLSEIFIRVFKEPKTILGASLGASSARTIAQADNKWYILNPISNFNCLFQSVAVARNYKRNRSLLEMTKEGQEDRVSTGRELKRASKCEVDNYADPRSIQQLANFTRYPIILYNNLFQNISPEQDKEIKVHGQKVKNYYKPVNMLKRYKNGTCYEIQAAGIHCKALIRWIDIVKKYPDLDLKKEILENNEPDDKTKDQVIKKINFVNHKLNYKIAAWDIETSLDDHNNHKAYACSVAWYDYKVDTENILTKEIVEKQFWGLNCLKDFANWLHTEQILNGYTLYAHNGGKFDVNLLISEVLLKKDSPYRIVGKNSTELNGSWINFTIRDKDSRKNIIHFKDSMKVLPGSLKTLCEEFDVEHKKLTETVDHNEITLQNYSTFPEIKKYLTHDVFGLLEIMDKFSKDVFLAFEVDITKCHTGASLSKTVFFTHYYDIRRAPIYTLSEDNDRFIRASYFGGRVEAFKIGPINKCYYYDFTSLYPYVGCLALPYGKPIRIKFDDNCSKLDKHFFGFVECYVRTTDSNKVPLHAVKSDNKLIFPVFKNWTKIKIFTEEIRYDQYEYKFLEGIKFKRYRLCKKYFMDGFKNKAKYKKLGKITMTQIYKIILNSGYGFFGIRTKGRDGVMIMNKTDNKWIKYLNEGKLISFAEYENCNVARVQKDLDITDFNVGIAAAISSYARQKTTQLIQDIKNVGGNVYYCDTDSVICDINIELHETLQNKYQWDKSGDELGSLKNECHDKCKIDKETKKSLIERENGNMSFDKGIITGCKQYALYKNLELNGKNITITASACKGFSKKNGDIKYEQMEEIYNTGLKQETTRAFLCPKSNFVNESETKRFKVSSQNATRSFNVTCNKGYLNKETGDVTPLQI